MIVELLSYFLNLFLFVLSILFPSSRSLIPARRITTGMRMEERRGFQNYDDEEVYRWAQDQAINPSTRNFVVEFGQDESKIAFDLSADDINQVCNQSRESNNHVRWINLWSPHLQPDIVNVIAKQYWFRESLTSVMCSAPPESREIDPDEHRFGYQKRQNGDVEQIHADKHHFESWIRSKDDVELAISSTKDIKALPQEDNHYTVASEMINYQTLHVGQNFLCAGANYMHSVTLGSSKDGTLGRLWSWIILGDHGTIITMEEQPLQFDPGRAHIIAIRSRTMSILSQLSKEGFPKSGSVSILSLRSPLDPEHYRIWATSDLFYYLFDDWHTTYMSVVMLQKKVDMLRNLIKSGRARKESDDYRSSVDDLVCQIGNQLRQSRLLYDSYDHLIGRMFKCFAEKWTSVELSVDARRNFESLQGRLQRLILRSIEEADKEKTSLDRTYTAQQDFKARASTSSAIVFVAKLAVLFLPVMLMTEYFSTNLADLQGVYTITTYWVTFAVVAFLSCVALFFLDSRLATRMMATINRFVRRPLRRA